MDPSGPAAMRINLLILSSLLFLAFPAVAHGDKGYQGGKSFDEVKAMKLRYLRRMTACVADTSNFEEMKRCQPKRRRMAGKPDA